MRPFLLLVGLVLVGCDSRTQVVQVPTKKKVIETAEHVDGARLPHSLGEDLAELLSSTGDTTTVEIAKGTHFVVRIYLNRGGEEKELLSQKGVSAAEGIELGLYCVRDHRMEGSNLIVEKSRERVILELPDSASSAELLPWDYRPMVFHRRQGIAVSDEEQAIVVMYHPNLMTPDSFADAIKFAREEKVESLVATIALSE